MELQRTIILPRFARRALAAEFQVVGPTLGGAKGKGPRFGGVERCFGARAHHGRGRGVPESTQPTVSHAAEPTKSGRAKLCGKFGRATKAIVDAKRMCSLDAISRRLDARGARKSLRLFIAERPLPVNCPAN